MFNTNDFIFTSETTPQVTTDLTGCVKQVDELIGYSFQCSLVLGTVALVQPSTGPSRLWHVVCAEHSFQCSLVHGTVAPVQPSTGLPRLWHVACAELFFQERTRGKARWPAVLGSASQGTERAVPHKLTRGKARWLAVLGSASHRHSVIASMRVAVLAETPRTVAAFLCTLAAPQVRGSLQHIHITLASSGRTEALHRAEHRPWSWALSFTH